MYFLTIVPTIAHKRIALNLVFVGFLFFINNPPCASQWQFLGSPETGRPLNFAGHNDSLFLCSEAGLFFSKDQGNRWTEINTPDTIAFFHQVEFQNGNLYIVTSQGHDYIGNILVFRSSDFGTTWIDITPEQTRGFDDAVFHVRGDRLVILYTGTIAISNDRGDAYTVNDVIQHPLSTPVITDSGILATHRHYILRTIDFGATWDTLKILPASNHVARLLLIDGNPWCLHFISTSKWQQIWKSSNDGIDWNLLSSVVTPTLSTGYLAGNYSNLFLTGHDFGGHFHSVDGGITWAKHFTNDYLGNLFYTDSILFASDEFTIQRSTNNGESFVSIMKGFRAANVDDVFPGDEKLFIQSDFRTYQKAIQSQNWFQLPFQKMVQLENGHLIGDDPLRGFYYSNDGGSNWAILPPEIFGGASETYYNGLQGAGDKFFLSGNGHTWYFKETNDSWLKITDPDLQETILRTITYNDGKYLAFDFHENILISHDGIIWENITYDFPEFDILSGFDASALWHFDGSTYAYMNNFFGKLLDGGNHWEAVNLPVPPTSNALINHPVQFLTNHGNTLISGVLGQGVFTSNDKGNTWARIRGLEDGQINMAKIFDDELYVGVNGGVWKKSLNDITTGSNDTPILNEQISVYPLPASDFLTINFPDHFLSEDIRLVLLDNTCRLTKSKIVQPVSIVQLDVHDVVPGIYFLQISSGNHVEIVKVVKQ